MRAATARIRTVDLVQAARGRYAGNRRNATLRHLRNAVGMLAAAALLAHGVDRIRQPHDTALPAPGPVLPGSPSPAYPGVATPDRRVTPGAVNPAVTQETVHSTICRAGWTATVRPPVSYTRRVKDQLLARQGMAAAGGAGYELDHLIPLELGGDPGYTRGPAGPPANLWLEPWAGPAGAHGKDHLEDLLHRQVCTGRVLLRAAQQGIGIDWYGTWLKAGRP